MGATPYADALGTGVTFRVWAPNATSVAVPGQFNGWNTTANYLGKEAGTENWSDDIAAARPGHEYKYHLNGAIWKRDPRGRKVVNSAGNTIVYDPNAFNWAGDSRLAVHQPDLVIYEMHVGAFYDPTPTSGGHGRFADAMTKLDHLASLGINAVELLPLAEFPGDNSWGYNPADPYAVENIGYGGPDGLKNFVKAAHARGIHVLLDVVHNHYGPSDLDLWGFDNGIPPASISIPGRALALRHGANVPTIPRPGCAPTSLIILGCGWMNTMWTASAGTRSARCAIAIRDPSTFPTPIPSSNTSTKRRFAPIGPGSSALPKMRRLVRAFTASGIAASAIC
ncbi:MAG: alpha-amylase family glycosyl hydrolase [Verrucomicrobiota bacterium]